MIDICGTPPEGAGLQNLRKAIIQMKYKWVAIMIKNSWQSNNNHSDEIQVRHQKKELMATK